MRAVLSKAPGGPETLVVEEVSDPTPKAGEVVIEVRAVGINFPDTLIIEDKYQFRPERPFAPGAEVAGVVEAIGEGVKGIHKGDRVIAVPGWGGLVERIAVPAASVIPIPREMDFETAAALIMTYGTSYYALKDRAKLQAGETLLVLGAAGSTGLAAISIGRAMGARVIAVASSEEKQQACLEAGAEIALPYEGLREALKQHAPGGVDVAFDPVGGAAFDVAARAMARNGRLLVIGFASGEIPKLPVNLVLLKEYSLVGVFWGAFVAKEPEVYAANNRELFAWHSEGRIKTRIDEQRPLADAAIALQRILDRGAIGKTILTP